METQIDLARIEEAEEEIFTKGRNYNSEEIRRHREFYTPEQRAILVSKKEDLDEEQARWRYDFSRKNPVIEDRRNKRIENIFNRVYNHELKKVLSGESEDYPEFRRIKITRNAYEQANLISERVVEVSSSPNEVYFYALGDKEKIEEGREGSVEIPIKGFYIMRQSVSPSFCRVDGLGHKQDHDEISGLNKRIIGWSHSHGLHPVFHSSTDNGNLENIPCLYGTKRTILLDCFIKGQYEKFEVMVAPSLVFNARGSDPDLRIVSEYRDLGKRGFNIFVNENPELEIIEDSGNIDEEIWRKVRPETGFTRSFQRKMGSVSSGQSPDLESVSQTEERPERNYLQEIFQLRETLGELEQRVERIEGSAIGKLLRRF